MSKKKESPWASDAERAAVVVPDTRTPAEKRLHQLIEAESVPELCGSDYSQALYKAALKMAASVLEPMGYELSYAIQEHKRNRREHIYFSARPEKDSDFNRVIFRHGFDHGYKANDHQTATLASTTAPQPAAAQKAVVIDQSTMELAESVGLIGPASRTDDLHGAIQRLHDLICINATIKAAKMAADTISEATSPAAQQADQSKYCLNCEELNKELAALKKQPQIACRAECGKKDSNEWTLYCEGCMNKLHANLELIEKQIDAAIAKKTRIPSPKNHGDI